MRALAACVVLAAASVACDPSDSGTDSFVIVRA
jgi:hypothetical protein